MSGLRNHMNFQHQFFRVSLPLALGLLLVCQAAWAATVVLNPVLDNSLFDPECEKSNGIGEFMFAGNTDGQGLRRCLMAFDIAGNVPPGSAITSVSLKLYMSRSNTGSQPHSLHVVLQEWGEGNSDAGDPGGTGTSAETGDATWCYRIYNKDNPEQSLVWNTDGGDFVSASSADQSVGNNGYYTWTSAQMATDVQDWLDNPGTDFGWLLKGNEGPLLTAKRFDTRERSDPSRRPELTIVYGQAATPPQVTVIQPNGGELITANGETSVRWTASDESGIAFVDLYISLDNGVTYEPVALGLDNTPPYAWFPANRPTTQALLRVVATDNTEIASEDVSNAVFTIASPPGGAVPTTLRDFDQPGTQPLTGDQLKAPDNCATCHADYGQPEVEPYFNWAGSMMAQASFDLLFEACLAVANQDAPDSGDLCLRCHNSRGWLNGRSIPTDGSQMLDTDKTGVSCNLCHRMVDPIPDAENPLEDTAILNALEHVPETFGTGMFVIDPDASARRGPFADADSGHAIIVSPFHRESALCGTCHDVSNPAFVRDVGGNYVPNAFDAPATDFDAGVIAPVERTYSEWLHSDYNSAMGVFAPEFGGNKEYVSTCQDCHMRDVTGQGCNDPAAPVRNDLPLHDMTGGSTWLPGLLGTLYPGQFNEAALQAGIERARYMLRNAAVLEVTPSQEQLLVRVTNNTGHKLPTGYPEGRRMWLNVRFLDAGSNLLAESAAYNHTTGELTHDAGAKVYEVEPCTEDIPGLPDGSLFHFVLNNAVLKDNRIPPRGFTNAAFAAFGGPPVAYTYADGQYWDETTYPVPPTATTVEVTLFYQSTTKEFVEFLRDENTTNSKGQELYDLWDQNGKCPPDTMASRVIDLTAVAVSDDVVPALETRLVQNVPNPFNPSTEISFALAARGKAKLKIYSIGGELVKTLVDDYLDAGPHEVSWDGSDSHHQPVASGAYFYRLEAGSYSATKRMMLLK